MEKNLCAARFFALSHAEINVQKTRVYRGFWEGLEIACSGKLALQKLLGCLCWPEYEEISCARRGAYVGFLFRCYADPEKSQPATLMPLFEEEAG